MMPGTQRNNLADLLRIGGQHHSQRLPGVAPAPVCTVRCGGFAGQHGIAAGDRGKGIQQANVGRHGDYAAGGWFDLIERIGMIHIW